MRWLVAFYWSFPVDGAPRARSNPIILAQRRCVWAAAKLARGRVLKEFAFVERRFDPTSAILPTLRSALDVCSARSAHLCFVELGRAHSRWEHKSLDDMLEGHRAQTWPVAPDRDLARMLRDYVEHVHFREREKAQRISEGVRRALKRGALTGLTSQAGEEIRAVGRLAHQARLTERYTEVAGHLAEIGLQKPTKILAFELNQRGCAPPRAKEWSPDAVRKAISKMRKAGLLQ